MARSGGDALKIREARGLGHQGEQVWDKDFFARDDSKRQVIAAEKYGDSDTSWISSVPFCPVYTPSLEEFEDPLAYICSIAPTASKYGICKIISPLVPSVPAGKVLMKEKAGFKFHTRIQAMRLSNWDSTDKVTFLTSAQRYSFQEFEKVANKFFSRKFSSAAVQPPAFVEAEFWREIMAGKDTSIEYASDVDGSAFSSSPDDPLASSKWNLKILPCLSKSILRLLDTVIPGVTEPMLYIGMLFSMFAWHVEDHYLYSINYHHCGASKTWYGVPGAACEMFENVVKDKIYESDMLVEHGRGAAYDLLIGKTTMFPPSILLKHGVPVYKAVQAPGEFVITFPRSYHAGFSHGFNCGEAVNFAMADWFPFGTAACRRYSLLNRMPLLPHEELLWKETATLGRRAGEPDSGEEAVRLAFVRLMSFHHRVRWLLSRRGASLCILSDGSSSVSCALCKHICYVSFITCQCFWGPTCLNHAEEIRKCQCGGARRLVVNKNIHEMDALACTYRSKSTDQERSFLVSDGMAGMPLLEEDLVHAEDYKSYVPFENIEGNYAIVEFSDVVKDESSVEAVPPPAPSPDVKKPKPGVAVRTMPEKRPLFPKKETATNVQKNDVLHLCFKHNKEPGSLETADGFKSSSYQQVKLYHTSSGELALRLKDIAQELRFGSVQESMRQWQVEAKRRGFALEYSVVTDSDGQHLALTYKACERLKKLLSHSEAMQLRRLFGRGDEHGSSRTFGPEAVKRKFSDLAERASFKRLKEEMDYGRRSFSPQERSCVHPSPQTDSSVCMSSSSNDQESEVRAATNRRARDDVFSDSRMKRLLSKNGSAFRIKIKGPSLPGKGNGEGSGENVVQEQVYEVNKMARYSSSTYSRPISVEPRW